MGTMRVLTTRGGELVAPFGPLCAHDTCPCGRSVAALEAGVSVESVTVAERDDLGFEDLVTACAGFMARKGWNDENGYSRFMAEEAAEAAAECAPGTQLWPSFDYDEEEWRWYEEVEPSADQCF